VEGLTAGKQMVIGTGVNAEKVTITEVGTTGATTSRTAVAVGETTIPVATIFGFTEGQTITIGSGSQQETMVIAAITRPRRNFENPSESAVLLLPSLKG